MSNPIFTPLPCSPLKVNRPLSTSTGKDSLVSPFRADTASFPDEVEFAADHTWINWSGLFRAFGVEEDVDYVAEDRAEYIESIERGRIGVGL